MAKGQTFRRRKIKVSGHSGRRDTTLEVYPDRVRLAQRIEMPGNHPDLIDIVVLDLPAMEYLIKLWQEVQSGGADIPPRTV